MSLLLLVVDTVAAQFYLNSEIELWFCLISVASVRHLDVSNTMDDIVSYFLFPVQCI
jgi:hypothetical protein